jgi:tetratricopeptide (TPR) repeat protein
MGGLAEGRVEASLARARRYLRRGEAWAAVGEFTEHLARKPGSPAVRLEQARALIMAGVRDQAQVIYRDVHRQAARHGEWDVALAAFAEGRRSLPGLGLDASELARAAHRAEKVGDLDLATKIYQDLVTSGGRNPDRERGWVRLVLLLHADPRRQDEARDWLARARLDLPPGGWRDYLEREFNPSPGARAGAAPAPAAR